MEAWNTYKFKLLYVYIYTLTQVSIVWEKFIRCIIGTRAVRIITDGKLRSATAQYYGFAFFDYLVQGLKTLRDYFDVNADKIEIIKMYPDGDQTIIYDTNDNGLRSMIKYVDENGRRDAELNDRVFLKFEIQSTNGDTICLKQYLVNYKDPSKTYHHTLENIALFNELNIDIDNSIVNLSYFQDNEIKMLSFPYEDVKQRHVMDFYE